MDAKRRGLLARIAAAAAAGDEGRLAPVLREALDAGIPPRDLAEALLQVHLFAGYPRAIVAFECLADAAGDAHGGASEEEPAALAERGREVFDLVYAERAGAVLDHLASLHPDLRDSIVRDAYGRFLGRPFLDLREREVMAVAMLAVLRLPRQMQAHVRGAVRIGVAPDDLRQAVSAAAEIGGPEVRAEARAVLDREIP